MNVPNDKSVHKKVLSLMREYRLRPRDAYHLLIMQENGIGDLATFDTGFAAVFQKGLLEKVS